ncbi:MAG: TonB-dependent receptor [Myxococcota bacterium]|nr:TonB-dependent receptor [Myxococcota bacterium]
MNETRNRLVSSMRREGDRPSIDGRRIFCTFLILWLVAILIPVVAFAQSADSSNSKSESKSESETESETESDDPKDFVDYGQVSLDQLPEGEVDTDQYKGVEEILVTSQAGAQNLQDVGVSVSAFDSDYLEALGAQNIGDIAQFTPNLDIRSVFAASNPTLFIRGVGLRDFNANSQSSVAVYNDSIYMNSPAGQLGQFFDLSNVEVLRGPQGALYGRNASAGAILVNSRKPTGVFNGYSQFKYGAFNEYAVEGAVEVPVTDTLSARVAGLYRQRGGTTYNRCGDPAYTNPARVDMANGLPLDVTYPGAGKEYRNQENRGCFNDTVANQALIDQNFGGFPAINQGDDPNVPMYVNKIKNWAGRINLRYQPDEKFDFLLNVHGGMNRGDSRSFQFMPANQPANSQFVSFQGGPLARGYVDFDVKCINGTTICGYDPATKEEWVNTVQGPEDGDPFAGDYNFIEPEELNLYGGYLSGDIQLGEGLLLKTITGYEANSRNIRTDLDGSPFILLQPTLRNGSWQVTQDIKLLWDQRDDLVVEVGGTFLHESLWVDNYWNLDAQYNVKQSYQLATNYGGIYGWLSWKPDEWFSIDAGLRWNIESKEMDIQSENIDSKGFCNVTLTLCSAEAESDLQDDGFSGSITLNFQPTEEHLIYLKYSRGYKGPHINGLILNPNQKTEDELPLFSPVKPEKVDALELGGKSTWFDNQLTFNFAAFYYDYQDIQIFQIKNGAGSVPVNTLVNANDADIFGVEFEVRAHPLYGLVPEWMEGLEVFASFGWLNSTYTDFSVSLTTLSGGTNAIPITNVEDYSGNRLINSPEYSFAGYLSWAFTSDYGTLLPRVDWAYKSEVFFSPANDPKIKQDPLWILNARLGYTTPDGNIEIAGWIQNLTDEVYRLDMINLARFRNLMLYAMGDPRTYGVTVQVRF